jgi:hypothetical protein
MSNNYDFYVSRFHYSSNKHSIYSIKYFIILTNDFDCFSI